jgi:SAM-dependent methyltransferase
MYFRYRKFLDLPDSYPKVLELGAGTGNNFPFWRSLGADYFGIELSASAVAICIERFPELQSRLQTSDFSTLEFAHESFDVICDRASVTHCRNFDVQNVILSSLNSLRGGGLYLGVDWFSKNHTDYLLPSNHIDENTRSDFMTGQFVGIGQVHFADREEMLGIFKDFEILELTEKIVTNNYPDENTHQFASWNIVARKPK